MELELRTSQEYLPSMMVAEKFRTLNSLGPAYALLAGEDDVCICDGKGALGRPRSISEESWKLKCLIQTR